jgi:hypothetical protein
MLKFDKDTAITVIFLIFLMAALLWAFDGALTKHVDNQNTMLCNSAKISGNEEWGKLCENYYKTGDITYLRGN